VAETGPLNQAILDTDIFSEITKGANATVTACASGGASDRSQPRNQEGPAKISPEHERLCIGRDAAARPPARAARPSRLWPATPFRTAAKRLDLAGSGVHGLVENVMKVNMPRNHPGDPLGCPRRWSQHFNRVGRHPNVNLLEPRLQSLLELDEELPMFRLVRDVYKDSDQVIAVGLAFVPPESADRLCL
jgi:hypothetical protein